MLVPVVAASGLERGALEALAPALVRVCRRMIRVPRGIDADDVEQQVVLQALRAARSMPLHEPPRRVERIELRVTTMPSAG